MLSCDVMTAFGDSLTYSYITRLQVATLLAHLRTLRRNEAAGIYHDARRAGSQEERLTTLLCAAPAWPSTKPYLPSVIGIPRMVGKSTTTD